MNAIFSKLRDFVGLSDPVDYDYEYDEGAEGDDYRDLYEEEQPKAASVDSATAARRRSAARLSAAASLGSTYGSAASSAPESRPSPSSPSSPMSNVIGMPGVANGISEVVVMEPRSFEEMPQAIQALRERKSVVLNLTMMDPDQAQRSVDFIAGGTYALDGHQERIGESIFLFTPNCVQVSTQSNLVREVMQAQNRPVVRPAATAWAGNRTQAIAQ